MQYSGKDLQGGGSSKDLQSKASSKDLQLKASSKDLQTKASQAEQQERMGKQYSALRKLFRHVDHRKAELGSAMIFATKYIRKYCTAHDALGPELTTPNPDGTIGIEGCKLNQLTLLYDVMSKLQKTQDGLEIRRSVCTLA